MKKEEKYSWVFREQQNSRQRLHKTRGDLLPEERPLASNTKATSIYLEGVQKPHRSEALGVTKGPVYHGKDFRLHSSSSPREGNTCSFLEQDVILPSNCRFWSGMNSLWCCLRVPLPCSGGNVEALSYLYHLGPNYPPLNITFMGFFHRSLSGQDRTGQSSAFRVPFSASVLLSRARITEEMDQRTPQPHCSCVQCGRACIAQQGQNSLRTSSWEPLSNSKSVNEWDVLSDVVMWRSHSISANSENKNQGKDWRSGRELGRHFLYPAMSPSVDSPFHTCSTYSSAPWELEI